MHIYLSMRAAGVESTAGRAVKCVDPSKTTRSEGAWLGCSFSLLLYNEERRLGVQRGLDTLVVPFVTSNYWFSVVYFQIYKKLLIYIIFIYIYY